MTPVPLISPSPFISLGFSKDAANTCGTMGGNCFSQMATAMEAAGVGESAQTIIKGIHLYDMDQ
ncbi:MAG: hypothetical protein DWQ37_05650 [Planctomycetota bacterium]|nr:MAG: hypothetical protein DWQ37_05650 [Planctomycetota bacterium]